ncbi:GFA family protein [Paraburkholderia tropica]|uniref:GFA family protein n=1 Tax=Paraburkholderia tropica TaxID=92647 RepID=UPI0009F2C542
MKNTETVSGSCLCGQVRFTASSGVHVMSNCHCSMCRKFSGSAYLTFARTDVRGFRWVQGEVHIRNFESSPGCIRSFCGHCGSPVPVVRPGLENALIPAGTLDDDPGVRPSFHIFSSSKAPWSHITDNLPEYDRWPDESIEEIGKRAV